MSLDTLLIKQNMILKLKEKMKKTYFAPEVEVIELMAQVALLAGSVPGGEGGGDDGGSDTNPTDPSDPGWGDDY